MPKLRALFIPLLILSTSLAAPVPEPIPPGPAKQMPPAGIAISDTDRAALTAGAAALQKQIDGLTGELTSKPHLLALLPDVEIFHKAVDWALRYDEFFSAKQVEFAKAMLKQGVERVEQLRAGKTPWTDATGLLVRGYRSRIDGSVQPYGLTVPATWKRGDAKSRRLDLWLLGRSEARTELAFLAERQKPSSFEADDTFVLTPYGRMCNATKFAGEQDVFEARAAVRAAYLIDERRIVVRGFSMGGASTWHLATHHSGTWCAASPGAGFAETPIYAKVFAEGKEPPPWWEQQLYHWYNATDYAANLFNCPTIAYSGEIDPQKQSADMMEKACAAEGLKLERIIGPNTAHKYEPGAKQQLAEKIDALAAKGRDAVPKEVRLTTYTLRYPSVAWVKADGLEKHWERADVRAQLEGGAANVTTKNVSALTLSAPGLSKVVIDGQTVAGKSPAVLHKQDSRWIAGPPAAGSRKSPGLQGPIDDAFMESFIFVRPTGKPLNNKLGGWVKGEFDHAAKMWRDVFRGDAPVKDDIAIGAADIAASNLVLWGDPSSNKVLAKILPQLPLKWDAKTLEFRGYKLDAAHHAPILIFPNPLNPRRYVLLNSGIDFRDDAYGTNSLQTPKLPDWALIDLRTPAGPRWPGLVVDAGFFDEHWR